MNSLIRECLRHVVMPQTKQEFVDRKVPLQFARIHFVCYKSYQPMVEWTLLFRPIQLTMLINTTNRHVYRQCENECRVESPLVVSFRRIQNSCVTFRIRSHMDGGLKRACQWGVPIWSSLCPGPHHVMTPSSHFSPTTPFFIFFPSHCTSHCPFDPIYQQYGDIFGSRADS